MMMMMIRFLSRRFFGSARKAFPSAPTWSIRDLTAESDRSHPPVTAQTIDRLDRLTLLRDTSESLVESEMNERIKNLEKKLRLIASLKSADRDDIEPLYSFAEIDRDDVRNEISFDCHDDDGPPAVISDVDLLRNSKNVLNSHFAAPRSEWHKAQKNE